MSEGPLLTVLMSVYNDSAYLAEAVESVLGQSRGDFEFLILDDGSGEETRAVLAGFRDARIRVVRNESNLGLTRSLRKGMELARGAYVARMDGDDVCLPGRFERQIGFLERKPTVGLLGGACVEIDEQSRRIGFLAKPMTDLEIRWYSLFGNPFLHSAVMLRREFFLRHGLNYDEEYATAQDYELWSRFLRVGRAANLAEPLIRYRMRAGVTQKRRAQQLENTRRIVLRRIGDELPEFSIAPERLGELEALFRPGEGRAEDFGRWALGARLPHELYEAFRAKHREHPELAGLERAWALDRMKAMVRLGRSGEALRMAWELRDLGLVWQFARHASRSAGERARRVWERRARKSP